MKYKYTDEELLKAVNESFSYANVMKLLGIKHAGGSQVHLKNRISRLNIDISHFTGQGWNKGKISNRRLSSNEILIKHSKFYKTNARLLKRALLENDIEYKCSECENVGIWNNKTLVLQIDHINGDNRDNRLENLRFLCPNCHSQTETFGNKAQIGKLEKLSDLDSDV